MNRKYQKGFTILEISVAGVLMVVVGVAIVGLQFVFLQNQNLATNSYTNVNEANQIVSLLTREIRGITSSDNGSYPLVTLSDNEFIFFTDEDFDGEVERVRYSLVGTVLLKGVIEPVGDPVDYPIANEVIRTITENVQNGPLPLFEYYNGDWPTDTTNNPLISSERLANTRTVRVFVLQNADPSEVNEDYELDSYATIRMLKDNL